MEPVPTNQSRHGRQRLNGPGRQPSKHSYKSFTNHFKPEVINHYAIAGITSVREKYFQYLNDKAWEFQRKLVYAWSKQRFSIERRGYCTSTANIRNNRPIGASKTLSDDAEANIVQ